MWKYHTSNYSKGRYLFPGGSTYLMVNKYLGNSYFPVNNFWGELFSWEHLWTVKAARIFGFFSWGGGGGGAKLFYYFTNRPAVVTLHCLIVRASEEMRGVKLLFSKKKIKKSLGPLYYDIWKGLTWKTPRFCRFWQDSSARRGRVRA